MSKIKRTFERVTLKAKKANDTVKPDVILSNAVQSDLPRGTGGKPDASTAKPKTTKATASKSTIGQPQPSNAVAAKPPRDSATSALAAAALAKPKTTKQEQVLTMLSQKGGVTINEVMKATGWQQHSVRGFFAGTVRKKLGFELTSEKGEGDDRRYAIKVAA